MKRFSTTMLVVYLALPIHALLAPSSTTGTEPIFVPDPAGRGTIGLLLSCIITLGLCIWTVVHPDIVANKSTLGYLIYKINWMMMALFVPEIIVSNSYHQWREAKRVHKRWCTLCKVTPGSEDDMGMEGAFFIVMGGCTVGGARSGYTSIITPDGFLRLTEDKNLSKDTLKRGIVKDKGKADALAKLLVCLQALWMVIQCAARMATNLPVTLLEYHIVIQVAYAIAMYRFWCHKPKDVIEHIEVIQYQDMDEDDYNDSVRVVSQDRRFVIDDLIRAEFDGHTDALTAAILGIPTSILHVLAWNDHFPSTPEKWIWRVSSIGIGVAPICMYLYFLASKYIVSYTWALKDSDPLYRRVHKLVMYKFPTAPNTSRTITSPRQMNTMEVIFYLTTWLNIGLYSSFSVLLGVVAFISVRSLPEGSYKTVTWGNYWPHFCKWGWAAQIVKSSSRVYISCDLFSNFSDWC